MSLIPMLLAMAAMGGQETAAQPRATPAIPHRPDTWLNDDDYSHNALTRGAFGYVRFDLDVDTTGRVSKCRIINTSGYWELDEAACRLLTLRARFTPARDPTGKLVAGKFHSGIWWALPEDDKKQWETLIKKVTEPIDVLVNVRKLPANYAQPPTVRIHFSTSGKPIECRVELESGNAAVDQIACQQVLAGATLVAQPPGLRSPDTRIYLVRFVAEASAK